MNGVDIDTACEEYRFETMEEFNEALKSLEILRVASGNQVDDKTLIRAITRVIHEMERRPIRRVINFLKKTGEKMRMPI
jgi:DNA polymerase/3'-5' exonuclease PolX